MKKLAFLVLIVLCSCVATAAFDDDANTFNATLRGINDHQRTLARAQASCPHVTPFSPAIHLGATRVFAIGIRSQRAAVGKQPPPTA